MLDRIDSRISKIIDWAQASHFRALTVIALVACLVALPGLNSLPVTDRDEARYVQASKQMMESGDYIDIRNQENPRWKKPVGIYWLQVASAQVLGKGAASEIWAYRVPSALAVIIAACLAYWAALALTTKSGAVIAGLVVASTATTAVEAHIAKTDAVLLAACVLVFGALTRIYMQRPAAFTRDHALLWLGLGFGFLIKGPIILIPFFGALIWLTIVQRNFDLFRSLKPLNGVLLFALFAAPWYVAIAIKTDGGFFAESLGKDLLGKVGQASEKHGGPLGYYLMTLWVTFWPWAPLGLLAIPLAWGSRRSKEIQLIAAWTIPCWAVFALTTTKLPHYILPCLPAIAALIGLWMSRSPQNARGLRGVASVLFVLGAIGVSVFAIAPRPYLEMEYPPTLIIAGMILLILICAAGVSLARARYNGFAGLGIIALILSIFTLTSITAKNLESLFLSPEMVKAHERFDACADTPIVSAGYNEMSLVFLSETNARLTNFEGAAEVLKSAAPGGRVFVRLDQESNFERFQELVGKPLETLATVTGTNYNSGREVTLALIAVAGDQILANCRSAAK